MAGYVKPLRGRPAALVPVAVAAWEEAWRRRGMSVMVLSMLSALTTDDAGRRLAHEPGAGRHRRSDHRAEHG